MKLISTVNLWCHLSLVLAAKAMSSNLLSEYQHGYLHHGNASIFSSPTNTSANASLLLAPFYRNVTAGGAWVLPASPFDLGARAMTCECFDPDEKCCMGSPPVVGPFCIPPNATCCSSTMCEPGETCCGDYCCRSGTTCSTDRENPGCCPLGQSCSADTPPPTCLDHSSNCSGKFPPKQCCPSDLPFCSSQEGKGFGCYATSAITVSSTQTISTQTVNLPPKTSSHQFSGHDHPHRNRERQDRLRIQRWWHSARIPQDRYGGDGSERVVHFHLLRVQFPFVDLWGAAGDDRRRRYLESEFNRADRDDLHLPFLFVFHDYNIRIPRFPPIRTKTNNSNNYYTSSLLQPRPPNPRPLSHLHFYIINLHLHLHLPLKLRLPNRTHHPLLRSTPPPLKPPIPSSSPSCSCTSVSISPSSSPFETYLEWGFPHGYGTGSVVLPV
ncbi:hypothetical protein XPA_007002 [Xanthoria parietina]